VASFTIRPLNPQGKSPWYPLDRRLATKCLEGRMWKEMVVAYSKVNQIIYLEELKKLAKNSARTAGFRIEI
jgi:hypothetical protein